MAVRKRVLGEQFMGSPPKLVLHGRACGAIASDLCQNAKGTHLEPGPREQVHIPDRVDASATAAHSSRAACLQGDASHFYERRTAVLPAHRQKVYGMRTSKVESITNRSHAGEWLEFLSALGAERLGKVGDSSAYPTSPCPLRPNVGEREC